MNVKNNLETFHIKCLGQNKKNISATIEIWTEKIENPEIEDTIDNKTYNFKGIFKIFFIKYSDETGKVDINKSDRLSNAFYGLRKKIEKTGIRMIIKGCNINFYMIPQLQYSTKAVELKLGERFHRENRKFSIFQSEEDISTITTIEEQINFYNKWAQSIKEIPY